MSYCTSYAIPPNAHVVGNGWKCNTGYKRQGQQCNKIYIPPNAVFKGQSWICKTGFKRVGQQCNRAAQKGAKKSSQEIHTPSSPVARQVQPSPLNIEVAVTHYSNGNYTEALTIFKPLANHGNARAQFFLGVMHHFGRGVLKDPKQAFNWFRKAAAKGHPDAQYNVGFYYAGGIGVLKDLKKAVYWYNKSAGQGHPEAQGNLAIQYALGEGILKDYNKAIYWFRKSAAQNDMRSQYLLGYFNCTGTKGVKKNLRQCAIWIKKAYDKGHTDAAKTWEEYELWKY